MYKKNILLTTNIDFKTATAIAMLNADGSQGSDAASDNGFFLTESDHLNCPTHLLVSALHQQKCHHHHNQYHH